MIRMILFFIVIAILAAGSAWFADQPGSLILTWRGYEIKTSFYAGLLIVITSLFLVLALWSLFQHMVSIPGLISRFFKTRQKKRGVDALSSGIIAVGSGDPLQAARYASLARKLLPNEPMTALLRAQAAQMKGDKSTARRIFESMLSSPDTELLGLRGLFLEARQENEIEAARQFAERALRLNSKLAWSVSALFEIQCQSSDWQGALKTLAIFQRHKHIKPEVARRHKAVLLTAQALESEEDDMEKALELSLEAHKLAPDLIPAANLAGRILATKGNTSRAARVIMKTWRILPHPELALTYAFARPGDSPRDRLKRIRILGQTTPRHSESSIAIASAAIEAHDWEGAREALEPLIADNPTARSCTLMARIEAGEHGDKGRVREWLARGLKAPRDPSWTADGYVSEQWLPVSPLSGELDAFEWKVPLEAVDQPYKISDQTGHHEFDVEDLSFPEPASQTMIEVKDLPPEEPPGRAQKSALNGPDEKNKSDKPFEPQDQAIDKDEAEEELKKSRSRSESGLKQQKLSVRTSAPAKSRAGSKKKKGPSKTKKTATKPKIFVPPRAPDDPGPGPSDLDEAQSPLVRYRTPKTKIEL